MVRRKLSRLVAALLLAAMLLPLLSTGAKADDTSLDTSFYTQASTAAAFFSNVVAKAGPSYTMPYVLAGNAGGFLGYEDQPDESGLIQGWLFSSHSLSSSTYDYPTLRSLRIPSSHSYSRTDNNFFIYAQYGHGLSLIGFDGVGGGDIHLVRKAGGMLMRLAYLCTYSVNYIFDWTVDMLNLFNPFKLFRWEGAGATILDSDSTTAFWVSEPEHTPKYIVAHNLTTIMAYFTSNAMRASILGLMLVALVVGTLLSNGQPFWPKFRKFLLRAVMITVGIPIIATTYTTMLKDLSAMSVRTTDSTDRIVLSTFVDFESWARYHHLALPNDTSLWFDLTNDSTLSPSSETLLRLRPLAYAINTGNTTPYRSVSTTDVAGAVSAWTTDSAWSGATGTTMSASVLDILDRYTDTTWYHATSFEGQEHNNIDLNDSYKNCVKLTGGKVEDFASSDGRTYWEGSAAVWNNSAASGSDEYQNIWRNGGSLGYLQNSATAIKYSGGTSCALSTMAMYNYLTSEFTDSAVIMYSNERASSDYVRKAHFSVNLIGKGFMSFLYWFNALLMLFVMTIVGWCYGFGVFSSSLKRTFVMIGAIPFAMLGNLRSMARVVIYAAAMILEIAMTLVAYYIMTEIILGFSEIVESPLLVSMLGSGSEYEVSPSIVLGRPAAILFGVEAVMMVALLLSCIILILFVILAVRVRKALVKFVDEIVTEIVEVFFGVKAGAEMAGGPGMGARMAGAVGTGLGAGLAHRIATSGSVNGSDRKDATQAKGVQAQPNAQKDGGQKGASGQSSGEEKSEQQSVAAGSGADEGLEANAAGSDGESAAFSGSSTDDEQKEIEAAGKLTSLSDGVDGLDGGQSDAKPTEAAEDGQQPAQAGEVEQIDDSGANQDDGSQAFEDGAGDHGSVDPEPDGEPAEQPGASPPDGGSEANRQSADGQPSVPTDGNDQGPQAGGPSVEQPGPGPAPQRQEAKPSQSVEDARKQRDDVRRQLEQKRAEAAAANVTPRDVVRAAEQMQKSASGQQSGGQKQAQPQPGSAGKKAAGGQQPKPVAPAVGGGQRQTHAPGTQQQQKQAVPAAGAQQQKQVAAAGGTAGNIQRAAGGAGGQKPISQQASGGAVPGPAPAPGGNIGAPAPVGPRAPVPAAGPSGPGGANPAAGPAPVNGGPSPAVRAAGGSDVRASVPPAAQGGANEGPVPAAAGRLDLSGPAAASGPAAVSVPELSGSAAATGGGPALQQGVVQVAGQSQQAVAGQAGAQRQDAVGQASDAGAVESRRVSVKGRGGEEQDASGSAPSDRFDSSAPGRVGGPDPDAEGPVRVKAGDRADGPAPNGNGAVPSGPAAGGAAPVQSRGQSGDGQRQAQQQMMSQMTIAALSAMAGGSDNPFLAGFGRGMQFGMVPGASGGRSAQAVDTGKASGTGFTRDPEGSVEAQEIEQIDRDTAQMLAEMAALDLAINQKKQDKQARRKKLEDKRDADQL